MSPSRPFEGALGSHINTSRLSSTTDTHCRPLIPLPTRPRPLIESETQHTASSTPQFVLGLVYFVESSAEARQMTYGELGHYLGLVCSNRTIARTLNNSGFRRCVAVSKPFLSEAHKAKRLRWALEHQDWDIEDWYRVIWTDESAMRIGGPQRLWVECRACA